VGAFDITLDQTHGTTNSTGLQVITIPAAGPFAPLPGAAPATSSANGAVASALASTSSPNPSVPAIPAWIIHRLSHLDLNHGPIAKYFEHLAHENTAKSRAILVKADRVADALHLDDALLNSLLVRLKLE
jgi:hypothetical protein